MKFSDAEVGLYMRLLCAQWNEGSLPDDDVELASYGKGLGFPITPLDRVKAKFKKGSDGRLRNERLEIERKKQSDYRDKQALNGKMGGRPRNPSKTQAFPNPKPKAKPNESSPVSSLQSPSTESPPSSGAEHQAFIKGWTEGFEERHGFKYAFQGRDAKAVQTILKLGIARVDLLETAKAAWARALSDRFATNCKRAATISGFVESFNQIRTELKNEHNNGTTKTIKPVAGSQPVGGF